MKVLQVTILFLMSLIISFSVRAQCPYTIKDAAVALTLEGKINLKITSSEMCNQKFYFADRFFDADVELWQDKKLVGKFYSRRVSYDEKNLKLILQNSTLVSSETLVKGQMDKTNLVVMDLKNRKLSTAQGEIHF